jgi:hypothetical protein
MLVRRGRVVPGWIERSVITAIGFTVAATLPLGSSSALAASTEHVSASTLMKDACKAFFSASAFRAKGHITSGNTPGSVDVYFGSAGTLLTLTQHGNQTVNFILDGSSTYLKANKSFWLSMTPHDAGAAALFADQWFDVTSDKKDFAGFAKSMNKKAIGQGCGQSSSTTRYVGTATVNGHKAIKIRTKANHESDTYYIESGSTPYLLRITGSSSPKDSGDLVFSDYGKQPDTSAPPGAISFPSFGGTGSTGSSGNTGNSGN